MRIEKKMLKPLLYYIISTRQLILELADGEEPNSICIPHYKQERFDKQPKKR